MGNFTIYLTLMGNAAVKAVSKKGSDKINPPPFESATMIPVNALFATNAFPIPEQVTGAKLYLITNSASK